jgi:beta-lactamase class A
VASAQSFASAREAATTYLIQPGDTLSAIATTTGLSVEKLVGLNSLTNPDLIIAGQSLSLSTTNAVNAAAPSAGKYAVKAGDTLWDIASATGTTVEALVDANNLSNADQLSVGQVLAVPVIQRAANAPSATAITKPKPTATPAPTQKPKPTPTPAPTVSPLQLKVAAEARRVGGSNVHVGVAATNLVTNDKVSLNASETFPSASVMKLPILVELERQIAAGTLSWTESLRAEAGAMIAVSDNTAANQIASTIHGQAVDDTMTSLGLGQTKFLNLFSDTRGAQNPGQNVTTPANMARLLELIATDQVVSPQVSADIRSLLARNADRSKLARLLPPDARVAHKSGWYEGVANDVGIVTVDRVPTRWVIAVFTENVPDAETGNQLVAAISKAVYDAWAP